MSGPSIRHRCGFGRRTPQTFKLGLFLTEYGQGREAQQPVSSEKARREA
jgi:hypothetical protein